MEGVNSILLSQMAHLAADHLSLTDSNTRGPLEEQLERKLHDPGRVRGVDHAKSGETSSVISVLGIVDVAIGLTKLGMVESVKEFGTKLQIHAFPDECVFQQRHVPIVQTRPREEAASRRAQSAGCFDAEQRSIEIRYRR